MVSGKEAKTEKGGIRYVYYYTRRYQSFVSKDPLFLKRETDSKGSEKTVDLLRNQLLLSYFFFFFFLMKIKEEDEFGLASIKMFGRSLTLSFDLLRRISTLVRDHKNIYKSFVYMFGERFIIIQCL